MFCPYHGRLLNVGASGPLMQVESSPHWIVPVYHRMRALSFGYALVFVGLYLYQGGYGLGYWVAAALQFAVYPQLVFWRARRAADSQRAELNNLLLDMGLWGLWAVALGFPQWVSFTLFITSAINNAISRGHAGLLTSLLVYGGGLGLGLLLFDFHRGPTETQWVSALCMLGLTGYLWGIGTLSFRRTHSLRRLRAELLQSQAELQAANDALRARLAEIEGLQHDLEQQANRDPLTSMFNRRYLEATTERELARGRREQAPAALLLIDIDHFKSINDRFGHAVGDEVLRQFGALLQAGTRREDVPCRLGGEEFVLLLPGMPMDKALARAETIRQQFEQLTLGSPQGAVSATISIGVASFPAHGEHLDELIKCADWRSMPSSAAAATACAPMAASWAGPRTSNPSTEPRI